MSVRIHGDEKFMRLSRPQPNGQSLFLYLLTGPHGTAFPGLFCLGENALAEALGWELEPFREAFRELFREGLAEADWSARVIWLPNAVRHNAPENPNVVKHWADRFDEVPDCPLKRKALILTEYALRAYAEGWREAFHEVFGKGYREALRKGLPEGLRQGLPESVTVAVTVAGTGTVAGTVDRDLLDHGGALDVFFERLLDEYPEARRQDTWRIRTEFCRHFLPLQNGQREKLFDTMLAALRQHKRSEQWQTVKLIPMFGRWIDEKRWIQVLPEHETATPPRGGKTATTKGKYAGVSKRDA